MSPDPAWPWSVLGLPRKPATLADVRRAYARALKQVDQATDIAGFAALRAAYDDATRRMTTAAKRAPAPPLPDAPPPAVTVPAVLLPPAPVHPEPVHPEPVPPVNTAPVDTVAQRDAAFAALLSRMQTHSIITHLGDRIIAALADPLAQDPAYDTTLRRTIAGMLRNQLQPDGENGLYLSSSLRGAVQALDKRYQWLSDYTAFRRDFWDQPFLLDAMMACAGLRGQPAPRLARNGRRIGPREQRLSNLLGSTGFWLGYGAFLFLCIAVTSLSFEAIIPDALRPWVFFACVFSAPLLALAYLAYGMVASATFALRGAVEKFQDRRALRSKGLLAVEKSILQRLRANPNKWVYAGFAAIALTLLWGLIANA